MKSAKQFISTFVLKEGINYVEKNPLVNMPKLVNWVEKILIDEKHKKFMQQIKVIVSDPKNNWNVFIQRILTELNPTARKKFLLNYIINSGIIGGPQNEKLKQQYDCNIPWAILMDPTSLCNLKCTGCWAAEYDKSASLGLGELDQIIEEGKELGIYIYIYSGGEPLVRKDDLLLLAEKHDDCMFLSFTNGILVDEEFAQELSRLGNFMLAISVEGFASETDMRRGKGTYEKVMQAMDVLKTYGIGFGFSSCYHHNNTEIVSSDEYIDLMMQKGCLFGWYFTYLPIGKEAVPELMVTSKQRELMYHRVRDLRTRKPIFLMDFWNDGEFVQGCIAGGRKYLHINANGDIEPCAFIHYANLNIREASLLEALHSPLFNQYKQSQPFNPNHLRPCPLLDNPDQLKEMVHISKAHSTQLVDQESVDELTEKCQSASLEWAEKAELLWSGQKSQQ